MRHTVADMQDHINIASTLTNVLEELKLPEGYAIQTASVLLIRNEKLTACIYLNSTENGLEARIEMQTQYQA